MAWRLISTDDVLSEFTPIEQATLQNIQGTADTLSGILERVIARVRGAIKAGGNQLDTSAISIPDQLVEETIAIARWRWLSSFPALKSLKTDDRKTAAADAEALLKEIASNTPNRPRVELPPVADATPAPSTMPSVGDSKRVNFTSTTEDGI